MEALGRELIEAVREGTDLSYDDSKLTVAAIVATIQTRIAEGAFRLDDLLSLVGALDKDLLDVSGCGDAVRLREIHSFIRGLRLDSQERSWSLHEDAGRVLDALQLLADLWAKADPRVPLHILHTEDYDPLKDLIELHQMETRGRIRSELIRVLSVGLGLGAAVVEVGLSSVLGTELGRGLVEERRRADVGELRLLTRLFSTAAPIPYTHYQILNEDFVLALLELGESEDDDMSTAAHQTLIAFSLHFHDPEDSTVMRTLKSSGAGRKRLSENIVTFLNEESDPVWMFRGKPAPYVSSTLTFLTHVFRNPGLGDDILYSNDAIVLIDILLRQLTDSGPTKLRSLGLRVAVELGRGSDWLNGGRRWAEMGELLAHIRREEALPPEDAAAADDLQTLLSAHL